METNYFAKSKIVAGAIWHFGHSIIRVITSLKRTVLDSKANFFLSLPPALSPKRGELRDETPEKLM